MLLGQLLMSRNSHSLEPTLVCFMWKTLATILGYSDLSKYMTERVHVLFLFHSATFDYESTKELSGLVLSAQDGGQTPRSSENADVTIYIQNMDDNEPDFVQESFGTYSFAMNSFVIVFF